MNKPAEARQQPGRVLEYYASTEPVDNDGIAESKMLGPFLCKSEAIDAAAKLNGCGHAGTTWTGEFMYASSPVATFDQAEAEQRQQEAQDKLEGILAGRIKVPG